MLYREIMAVCSEIHTKHINTVCGQNVELLNVKPGAPYSNHRPLTPLLSRTVSQVSQTPLPTATYIRVNSALTNSSLWTPQIVQSD
jgi:hypothetical protein